jgi:hypothetical protein
MSYVRQATGDLDGALKFAEQAADLAPQDAYAVARLAEMQMVVGDRRGALATANRALAVERIPLALFVAGLAELAGAHYEKAEALFNEAIALDNEAPIPRLGLGLAYIRQGHTAEGWSERLSRLALHRSRSGALFRRGADRQGGGEPSSPNARIPGSDALLFRRSSIEPPDPRLPRVAVSGQACAARDGAVGRGLAEDEATRAARVVSTTFSGSINRHKLGASGGCRPFQPGSIPPLRRRLSPAAGARWRRRANCCVPASSSVKTPVPPTAESALSLDTTGPSRGIRRVRRFSTPTGRLDASGLMEPRRRSGRSRSRRSSTASFSVDSSFKGRLFMRTTTSRTIFDTQGTVALTPEFSVLRRASIQTAAGDRTIDFNINDLTTDAPI